METLGESPDGNLYDVNWESNVMHLCWYVPIMSMTNVPQAMAYIQEAVDDATPEEREQLNAAVLGRIPVKHVNISTTDDPTNLVAAEQLYLPEDQKGGADLHPLSIHDTNEHAARLMELIDAIHDFANEYPPNRRDNNKKIIPESDEAKIKRILANVEMRKTLKRSIKAVIPTEIKLKSVYHPGNELKFLKSQNPGFVITPEDKELALLADKNAVSRLLSDCDELHFIPNVPVANPLKKRSLESTQKTLAGTPLVECKDIYFDARPNERKIAVVLEVLDLRRRMEMFYTTKRESKDLQDMSLNIMIDQCMTTKHNREPSALFSWMTGLEVMIDGLNKFFTLGFGKIIGDEINGPCTFTSHYCDVSAYDNEDPLILVNNEVFSPGATGDVFHKESEVRMSFDASTSLNEYAYTINTTDPNFNPIPWTDYGDKEDKVVVKDKYIINESKRSDEDNSAKKAKKLIKDLKMENSKYGTDYHFAVPAAIKRAGDWGQIEHCKQKKLIFVTSDIVTALYAAYRDVPVFLVKHDTHTKNQQVRFSFIMCGSEEARRGCCARNQKGGNPRTNLLLNFVLVTVILAASFF